MRVNDQFVPDDAQALYVPGAANLLALFDDQGRELFTMKPVEQVKAENPGALLTTLDKAHQMIEDTARKAPTRITAEQFEHALNVLPPARWERSGTASESFQMIEHTNGRITAIDCRIFDAYYVMHDVAGMKHADIVKACAEAEATQAGEKLDAEQASA